PPRAPSGGGEGACAQTTRRRPADRARGAGSSRTWSARTDRRAATSAPASGARGRLRRSPRYSYREAAERVGFEPTRQLSPPTRFPVVHLKPLGDLSESEVKGSEGCAR